MLLILSVNLLINIFLFLKVKIEDRIFLGLLLFSHCYFCLGGYYFWVLKENTFFAEVVGGHAVNISIAVLSISTTLIAIFVFLLTKNIKKL